ncbi:MAG: phosphoribosylaminoimidazolesuccinocarboxamide synthase [Candidatus Micrarchaeia archaeon]
MADVVLDTKFVEEATGIKPLFTGKVRETYDAGDGKHLVMIATDRMSAFDVVLPQGIPFKGKVLNSISAFWFQKLSGVVENHFVSTNLSDFPEDFRNLTQLEGRSMLVKKTTPFPIECIVRGFIVGSGWRDYVKTGSVCGINLPEGLQQAQKLEAPLFTPSSKSTEHDFNIDLQKSAELVGGEEALNKLSAYSLALYSQARDYADSKGVIIADTKFEFGLTKDGKILLIDECLTPDSSRFWPKEQYVTGTNPPSFDKQYLRDWLDATGWNRQPPAPDLPGDVVKNTSEKYLDAFEKLTGQKIEVKGY